MTPPSSDFAPGTPSNFSPITVIDSSPSSAPATPAASETLAGQPVGSHLRITGFALPGDVLQRLLEMGLAPGLECIVVRYAPLGDPLELRIRGYHLSLRAAEAAGVFVTKIS